MSKDAERTRTPNDKFCKQPIGVRAAITPGIAALGEKSVQRLIQTIAVFDDFCTAHDPHSVHNAGAFDFDNILVIFRIDYYDTELQNLSPVPTNPKTTCRVVTVMLASEY